MIPTDKPLKSEYHHYCDKITDYVWFHDSHTEKHDIAGLKPEVYLY